LKNKTICFFNSTKAWGGGEKWHYDISVRLYKKGYSTLIVTNKKSVLYSRIILTGQKVYNIKILIMLIIVDVCIFISSTHSKMYTFTTHLIKNYRKTKEGLFPKRWKCLCSSLLNSPFFENKLFNKKSGREN